jgi:hypothetical protein
MILSGFARSVKMMKLVCCAILAICIQIMKDMMFISIILLQEGVVIAAMLEHGVQAAFVAIMAIAMKIPSVFCQSI